MDQLRVVDLAHTMGITAKELIFKLRSIGVSVAGEEDTLDLSTVPVPFAPVISTLASLGATFSIISLI